MKRILLLATPPETDPALPAAAWADPAGCVVERRPLPAATAPAEDWDGLVAALLAADVVITD